MLFSKNIEILSHNYKRLFVIDGIGAFVSAFLLSIVLVLFKENFGLPTSSLYILATFPIVFGLYDFYCFLRVPINSAAFYLRLIAIANILYCLLSIAFAVHHFSILTYLGWIYIITEISIILCVVYVEFKVATHIDSLSNL